MLLSWMAYASVLASLVCLAAIAAERAAAMWRGGQRFVWIASLLIAAAAPAILATRPAPVLIAAEVTGLSTAPEIRDRETVVLTAGPRSASLASARDGIARTLPALDPYLRAAWLIASLICLALFARAALAIRRQRPRWRTVNLDGARVFVAPNIGPAVIGALRPDVIIPEWALSLDDNARALMLRHEQEHIRARDPLVLLAGNLAVALFPWNPALWLIVRRLRLAIEIDCDRRVLGVSTQEREYGMLLLTVGARNSASLPFATSLAERRPFLERRIRAMTAARPHHPRLTSSLCIALALVATTAAVRAPHPRTLAAQAAPAKASATQQRSPATAPAVSAIAPTHADVIRPPAAETQPVANHGPAIPAPRIDPIPIAVIRAFIAQHYPSVLQGDPSVNIVTFVLDAAGNYSASAAWFQAPETNAAREEMLTQELRGRGARGSGAGDAPSPAVLEALRTKLAALAAAGRAGASDSAAVYAALVNSGGRGRGGRSGDAGAEAKPDAFAVSVKSANYRETGAPAIVFTERKYVGDAIEVGTGTATCGTAARPERWSECFNGTNPLTGLVAVNAIQEIQLDTFGAGLMGPLPIRVMFVHLKPTGGQ